MFVVSIFYVCNEDRPFHWMGLAGLCFVFRLESWDDLQQASCLCCNAGWENLVEEGKRKEIVGRSVHHHTSFHLIMHSFASILFRMTLAHWLVLCWITDRKYAFFPLRSHRGPDIPDAIGQAMAGIEGDRWC